jgi:raffinose/stachyose/melibiose transport system substrate-binding protein
MKKLLLAALICLTAAGAVWAGARRDSSAPAKVQFLVNNAQVLDPYEKFIADYKAKTGVEVELGTIDATNEQVILTRFATKDYPDGFLFDPGTKQYTKFGVSELYEWTNDPLFNNVLPATKQFQTLDGKIYGVPWGGTNVYGVFYNKDVFAKAGVQPPQNWQDFISILDKLKAAGITPIFEAQTEWPLQVFFLASWPTYIDPALGTAGVSRLNTNQLDLADIPEVQQVFKRYYDLSQAGYFQQNYRSGTYAQQVEALGAGEAAMAFQIGNFATALIDMFGADEVNRNIGFFPIPGPADKGVVCLSPPNQFLIPANAKNVQGAVDFIHFMIQRENLEYYHNNKFSTGLPVYQSVNVELMDYMKTAQEFDNAGKAMINVQNRLGSSFTDLVQVLQQLMIDGDTKAAAQTLSEKYKQTGKARALPGF